MKVIYKYNPDPDRMIAALNYCAERGALRAAEREKAKADAEPAGEKDAAQSPEPATAKG